jgi:hypothetical protein
MPTCQCCGQSMRPARDRAASASAIWVDQALMECCNNAYEAAVSGAAAEVDVAHLLHAITVHRIYRSHLERFDLVPDQLMAITREALDDTPRALSWGKPRTSSDLKTLIERTWSVVRASENRAATVDDCLETLLHDCHDLACGKQVAVWQRNMQRSVSQRSRYRGSSSEGMSNRASSFIQNRPYVETVPPVRSDVPPQHWPFEIPSGHREPSHDYGHSEAPARYGETRGLETGSEVLQLLVRQERLLAQICAHVTAGNDAGLSRSAPPRPTRRKATNAAAPEGVETLSSAPTPDLEPPKRRAQPSVTVESAPPPSRHLKLRDRFRRGTWLQRPNAIETKEQGSVAAMDRTERGPRLSLVQAQSQERMAVPRLSSELADEEDDVDAFEDDAGDDGSENGERVKRFYLEPDDDIVRAPSIGPKTAARIMSHGIARVRDLLVSDPRKLAARIGARHITPERITLWQDQARLVCTVPWLRGTHAQILVGAGFNTVKKILSSEPIVICAAIRIFATTREGQSVLRSGPPPDDARVFRWVAHAQVAEAERAA